MKIGFQAGRNWSTVFLALICALAGTGCLNVRTPTGVDSSVFGLFVGSSPSGEAIRPVLGIPADAESDLIEWKLTLYQDPKTRTPSSYQLHCDYGLVVQGKPGLGGQVKKLDRQGKWKFAKGTKSNPQAPLIELEGDLALLRVEGSVLQVLNRDRSLMIGNGGWSYTLNRAETAEKPVPPVVATTVPEMSYTISPMATGPSVFGVFEGRTPCQGITRELRLVEHAGCTKAKWRVTLYQNPETQTPTTYKVEGTLYRRGAREGNWSIIRGTAKDPGAVVYSLAPAKAEAPLFLLKGDDNVLFLLNQDRKPLVGHAEFSYTLNRRSSEAPSRAEPIR